MSKIKKRKVAIILLFLAAFVLKALLTTLINKGDILAIEEWSRSLYERGLAGSYFREGWVYTFPTQPPLMMLLYWSSRWLFEHKFYLSLWHNSFRLPPAFLILWVDRNGPLFFVRFWGILADCLSAGLVYFLVKKVFKDTKIAFWAMFFLLFNPLIIFDSSIWGQVDLLAPLLALVSFLSLFFHGRFGKFASPVLFTCGILLKPTVLLFTPLYFLLFLKEFHFSFPKEKKRYLFFLLGLIFSIGLTLALFLPFWDKSEPFFKYVNSIVTRRIIPSAKGISKVANSGYTFFTIFYDIDKTLGSQRLGFLTLDQWGNLFFILINLAAAKLILVNRQESINKRLSKFLFVGYFVAEGTFLFKTGMAERYFFPAFLFIYILFFISNNDYLKKAILLQMAVWFINLTSSFFLSDYSWIDLVFRQYNYLGTRVVSLINVLVYLYIFKNYSKLNFKIYK